MLRMAKAGREAGVRGAVSEVLDAVIALLPGGWSKIRDNRIRLRQLVALCPSRPHQRTVGRALRRLADLDFLRYTPACGRGTNAEIVVHERFLDGVAELERDEAGSVIVPFSAPIPLFSQREKYLDPADKEPATQAVQGSRPVEVPVDRDELRAVLASLPPLFSELPRNLRWLLGREIKHKLARGHLPEEILRILEAPAPAGVERPYKLAVWRLTQNMSGSGPRLRPLQREWDQAQRREEEQARIAGLAESYSRIESFTTAEQRDQLVAAEQARVDQLMAAKQVCERRAVDPRSAVLSAVRRACRQHPGIPAAAAVARWLEDADRRLTLGSAGEHTDQTATSADSLSLSTAGAGDHSCANCGGPGVVRPELPLRTVACDDCFAQASVDPDEGIAPIVADPAGDQAWSVAS